MKRFLLLLSFSLLLSGCSASYDVPAQSILPYKTQPVVVQAIERQPIVNSNISPSAQNVGNENAAESKNNVNLSNDNSYINVDGSQVHSPAYADSIPSGASAICRDGTYSFSQHRQGTCSGHGGVASWY